MKSLKGIYYEELNVLKTLKWIVDVQNVNDFLYNTSTAFYTKTRSTRTQKCIRAWKKKAINRH